jgi:hypothetical protein
MSYSAGGLDFTGSLFGNGYDPSLFGMAPPPPSFGGGTPGEFSMAGTGAAGPFLGGTISQPASAPDISAAVPSAPGLPGPGAAPAPPAAPTPDSPGGPGGESDLSTRIGNFLSNIGTDQAGTSKTPVEKAAGAGQTGDFSSKLKTALAGLGKIASTAPTPAPAGQPGSAWPFGRPGMPNTPLPQSRGAPVAGVFPSALAALQAQQQRFMQLGNRLPPGAPGGGLLGM